MEQRTTSAGYRLPARKVQLFAPTKTTQQAGGRLDYSIGGQQFDAVSFEKVLTKRINNEHCATKKWLEIFKYACFSNENMENLSFCEYFCDDVVENYRVVATV